MIDKILAGLKSKYKYSQKVKSLIGVLKDKDEDRYTRGTAAGELGELKDSHAVEPLLIVLKDEDLYVRRRASEALGKLRDNRAVEPLLIALKDEDSGVRSGASEALGELRDNRAVEPLLIALKDEDSGVRSGASEALGKLRDNRAVEPLLIALKDENSRVQGNASWALGELKDNRAVEPLMAVLKEEKVLWVREKVTKALTMITGEDFEEDDKKKMEVILSGLKSRKKDEVISVASQISREFNIFSSIDELKAILDLLPTIRDNFSMKKIDDSKDRRFSSEEFEFEHLICSIGDNIWVDLFNNKKKKWQKNRELFDEILRICQDKSLGRGRLSFINIVGEFGENLAYPI